MNLKKILVVFVVFALVFTQLSQAALASSNTNDGERSINLDGHEFTYTIDEDSESIVQATINDGEKVSEVIYDVEKGEIYLDGELIANEVETSETIYADEEIIVEDDGIGLLSTSFFTLGNASTGSNTWHHRAYNEGTINLVSLTIGSIAAVIVVTLFRNIPTAAAVTGIAAAIASSVTSTNQTLLWNRYQSENSTISGRYRDSVNVYTGSRTASNRIVNVLHYWGKVR